MLVAASSPLKDNILYFKMVQNIIKVASNVKYAIKPFRHKLMEKKMENLPVLNVLRNVHVAVEILSKEIIHS